MLVRIETSQLKVGMFVSELDRPWIDTPFLIQGFLIQDDDDLSRLRTYCKFVLVDPLRSAAGVVPPELLRTAEQTRTVPGPAGAKGRPVAAGESKAKVRRPGSGEAADSPAEQDASSSRSEGSLIDSFIGFVGRLFGAGAADRERLAETAAAEDEEATPVPVRHPFLPPSVQLVAHSAQRTMTAEMPAAHQAFAHAQDVVLQVETSIRSGKALSLGQIQDSVEAVVDSMTRNPDALMWIANLERQGEALYGHALQAAVHLIGLGRHLGLPREYLVRLGMTGMLFDSGKTKLPRTLLAKRGQLTADEFALLKEHVSIGLDLLRDVDLHPAVRDGIAQHHEREDGSGYPKALSGSKISLSGRMAAIVDVFVALTNPRAYAEAIAPYDALRKLSEWSATLFHATLVEQFVQAIGVFPVGSLIELSTGEVGVVVRQSRVRRLKPRVLIVSGRDKQPIPIPSQLDLLHQPAHVQPVHIVSGLPMGAYGLDGRAFTLTAE